MWNMGAYPLYIPAKFGDDTWRQTKGMAIKQQTVDVCNNNKNTDETLQEQKDIHIHVDVLITRNQIPGYLIRTSNITEPSYLVKKNH